MRELWNVEKLPQSIDRLTLDDFYRANHNTLLQTVYIQLTELTIICARHRLCAPPKLLTPLTLFSF